MGDKYIQAYRFYRDELDEQLAQTRARVADLERTIEWMISVLLKEKKE